MLIRGSILYYLEMKGIYEVQYSHLTNVLRNPVEGEAGLVRHNVQVLTDSLT